MNSDYIRQLFDKQSGYGSSHAEQTTFVTSNGADGQITGPSQSTSNTLRQLFDNSGSNQSPVIDNGRTASASGQPPAVYDHSKIASQTPFRTILKVAARRHADSIAVKVPNQKHDRYPHLAGNVVSGPDSGLQWSYSKLYETAGLLAAALYDRGVRRGKVIAVFLLEGVEVALFFWASVRLGAIFVPLPGGTTESARTEDMLSRLPVGAIVVASQTDVDWWQSLSSSAMADRPLQIVARDLSREDVPPGWYSSGTLLKIWNLNADYILKNVDADAAREDWPSNIAETDHASCVGDHLAMVSNVRTGMLSCYTSEALMDRTSATINELGLTQESFLPERSDMSTAEGFVLMAAAFRVGAPVILSETT